MIADAIQRNRERWAAAQARQQAALEARGFAPRGDLAFNLAAHHPEPVTVPAAWAEWGTVTTPDGIAGGLYREPGGRYWQATPEMWRTLSIADVARAFGHIETTTQGETTK
jgi:hypothetical protein